VEGRLFKSCTKYPIFRTGNSEWQLSVTLLSERLYINDSPHGYMCSNQNWGMGSTKAVFDAELDGSGSDCSATMDGIVCS
jgi:hypothetical protein